MGVGGAGGVLKKSASVNAVVTNSKAVIAKTAEEKTTTPLVSRPVAAVAMRSNNNDNQLQQNNNPNNNHPYDSLDSKDIAQYRTPSSSSSSSSSDHKRLPAPNQHDHKMIRQVPAEVFPAAAVAEDKKRQGQVRDQGYKHGYSNNNRGSIDIEGEEEEGEEEEEDERLNQSVELHSTLVYIKTIYSFIHTFYITNMISVISHFFSFQ